jgi:hypothetical protein
MHRCALARADALLCALHDHAHRYDPLAIPALLRAVSLLLSRGAHDATGRTGYVPPPHAAGTLPARPQALLFSMLRQESSLALFVDSATAAGLAPRDVTAEVLGPDCGAGSGGEGGSEEGDAAAPPPPPLPFGAVRLCHLPAGALPRRRVRAHRLHAPTLLPQDTH